MLQWCSLYKCKEFNHREQKRFNLKGRLDVYHQIGHFGASELPARARIIGPLQRTHENIRHLAQKYENITNIARGTTGPRYWDHNWDCLLVVNLTTRCRPLSVSFLIRASGKSHIQAGSATPGCANSISYNFGHLHWLEIWWRHLHCHTYYLGLPYLYHQYWVSIFISQSHIS